MRDEWQKVRLGDVAEVVGGGTPSTKNPANYGGEIPWITPKDLSNYQNVRIVRGERNITAAGLQGSGARLMPKGSILFSSRAPIGYVAIADCELCTNQGFKSLIPGPKLDSLFGYYLLTYNKVYIESKASGTTFKEVNASVMRNVEIIHPPLATQQRIAAVLGALDDKIELNRKMNANLEAQAQALFKSWFVDFEPFGGKMPEGWKKESVYSLCNIIYGAPYKSALFNEEGVGRKVIRIRDLKNQDTKVYTPEVHEKEYLVQPGDIVLGMDGEFTPYVWGGEIVLLNQRLCVFNPIKKEDRGLLYFQMYPQLKEVERTEVATTVIHIGKQDFDRFVCFVPDDNTRKRFSKIVEPMLSMIVSNSLESRKLAETRDALLPKLMKGEIEV